jgi:hypothetical protein
MFPARPPLFCSSRRIHHEPCCNPSCYRGAGFMVRMHFRAGKDGAPQSVHRRRRPHQVRDSPLWRQSTL